MLLFFWFYLFMSNSTHFANYVLTAKLLHFHFLFFDVKLPALLEFMEAVSKMCYKHLLQKDPREPNCKISHSDNPLHASSA